MGIFLLYCRQHAVANTSLPFFDGGIFQGRYLEGDTLVGGARRFIIGFNRGLVCSGFASTLKKPRRYVAGACLPF